MNDFLKSPFGFLFVRSQKEKLIAEYVIREHAKGRTLDDILDDAYVTNRLSPEQVEPSAGAARDRPGRRARHRRRSPPERLTAFGRRPAGLHGHSRFASGIGSPCGSCVG